MDFWKWLDRPIGESLPAMKRWVHEQTRSSSAEADELEIFRTLGGFEIVSQVGNFVDGLAPARDIETGLVGFIDLTVRWAISPQFEEAHSFVNGRAVVSRGGKWFEIPYPVQHWAKGNESQSASSQDTAKDDDHASEEDVVAAACFVLEVGPDATWEQIVRSHKDLVKVWHPDRYSHDPDLQLKCQEKLKAINSAFEFLRARR